MAVLLIPQSDESKLLKVKNVSNPLFGLFPRQIVLFNAFYCFKVRDVEVVSYLELSLASCFFVLLFFINIHFECCEEEVLLSHCIFVIGCIFILMCGQNFALWCNFFGHLRVC